MEHSPRRRSTNGLLYRITAPLPKNDGPLLHPHSSPQTPLWRLCEQEEVQEAAEPAVVQEETVELTFKDDADTKQDAHLSTSSSTSSTGLTNSAVSHTPPPPDPESKLPESTTTENLRPSNAEQRSWWSRITCCTCRCKAKAEDAEQTIEPTLHSTHSTNSIKSLVTAFSFSDAMSRTASTASLIAGFKNRKTDRWSHPVLHNSIIRLSSGIYQLSLMVDPQNSAFPVKTVSISPLMEVSIGNDVLGNLNDADVELPDGTTLLAKPPLARQLANGMIWHTDGHLSLPNGYSFYYGKDGGEHGGLIVTPTGEKEVTHCTNFIMLSDGTILMADSKILLHPGGDAAGPSTDPQYTDLPTAPQGGIG